MIQDSPQPFSNSPQIWDFWHCLSRLNRLKTSSLLQELCLDSKLHLRRSLRCAKYSG